MIRIVHRIRIVNKKYLSTQSKSYQDILQFWNKAASDIKWIRQSDRILDIKDPIFPKWFPNGILNTCYNAVDRHVEEGFGSSQVIIFDSPVTNTIRKLTYSDLLKNVQSLSALFIEKGIKKGDRVLIYMPNMPETVITMLACARIGAIHSVVFGGYAPSEIATRIKDSKPSMIVCTSCGIEGSKVVPYKSFVDTAIAMVNNEHEVKQVLVLRRTQLQDPPMTKGRDFDWDDSIKPFADAKVECEPMMSSDPSYILYTSGTTGAPKGVVRDTGGHAVTLKWSMKNVYNMSRGDVFWAASDVGWIVGHSYSVYGPLFQGCTTVLYEGKPIGTPDAANFWRTIERHSVNALFTAPTAIRAIKRLDPDGHMPSQFNLKSLRTLFLAGERADSESIKWAEHSLKVPVCDNWWQTETGWPVCANQIGLEGYLPVKYGSVFKPCPGYDLQVIDDACNPVPVGKIGSLAIKLPLPPGNFSTLYNNDDRFKKSYFTRLPGYYDTGDEGMVDEDEYFYVMSRRDDVINVAGHRLSTGAIEEVLASIPHVAEAAVVGVADAYRGQLPLGLIVLNDETADHADPNEVLRQAIDAVRDSIGAFAVFKKAVIVDKLPKTRSGKILRGALRSLANKDPNFKIPATCDDPSIFDEIEKIIRLHENDESPKIQILKAP